MHAYIFIFALVGVCVTCAFEGMEHCDVGTVLFSRASVNKICWTAPEIAVLRARKQFLDLLPPIHALNTRCRDFTETMITYLQNCFAEMKSDATNPETDKSMSLALSDAVGGYLKMWVLPVTKFAFYGGTVSTENALKLYRFHEAIKKLLKTDGRGWRSPTPDFLYSMSVDIAPIPQEYQRKVNHPCENIAYYERTKSGLVIPMPTVVWERNFECILIPIKNQRPVSLNRPDPDDSLIKYHNIAKHCVLQSNIEDLDSLEERFQRWLDTDITPHLKDEKLYPALRSVLSLVNKTNSFASEIWSNSSNKTCIGGVPLDLSSKKMMVITIIIILEIAWCIPTLFYLMCTRIKNKNKKIKMYYSAENNQKKSQDERKWTCNTGMTHSVLMESKQVSAAPSVQSCACLQEVPEKDVAILQNSIGIITDNNNRNHQSEPTQTVQKSLKPAVGPISKVVSIKISNQSSSRCYVRPHLTPTYDSSHSKTSVNSFTRFKVKKGSSSFIDTCCCQNKSSSSMKICNCVKESSSSFDCSCSQLADKTESSFKKSSSSSVKTDSSKSLIKSSFRQCNCERSSSVKCYSKCDCFNCIPEEDVGCTTTSGSFVTVQNLQPTETKTLLQDSMLSTNYAKTSSYIPFIASDRIELSNTNKEDKRLKKSVTISNLPPSQIMSIIEQDLNFNKMHNPKKSITLAGVNSSQESSNLALSRNKKPSSKEIQSLAIEKASKETMICTSSKLNKPGIKHESSVKRQQHNKQMLNITIDRNLPLNTLADRAQSSPAKSPRPSKIPKRLFTNTITQTKSAKTPQGNRKSLIPQRKQYLTLDDMALPLKKSSRASDTLRLNMTL